MKKNKYPFKRKKQIVRNELQFNSNDCIILDQGTENCNVGFSGEDKPRHTVKSCRFKSSQDIILGNNCFQKGPVYSEQHNKLQWISQESSSTIQSRFENDKEGDMNFQILEQLWNHIFTNTLKMETTENCSVIITERAVQPKMNRIKIAEILFGKFKIPKLCFAKQPVLSMYAQGVTTGLSVEIGSKYCQICPVFQGYPLTHSVVQKEFGGRNLTDALQKKLGVQYEYDEAFNFSTVQGYQYVQMIKEKMCFVCADYKKLMENKEVRKDTKKYVLPDRSEVTIDNETMCGIPEILFNPKIVGIDQKNLPELIQKSYDMCDEHMKSIIQENIYLNGGSAMFHGLRERVEHELILLNKQEKEINVKETNERNMSSFLGCSILSSFSNFDSLCVRKSKFDEEGGRSLIFSNIF